MVSISQIRSRFVNALSDLGGTDAAVSVGVGLATALVSAVSTIVTTEDNTSNDQLGINSTVNTVSNLVGVANGWFSGLSEIAAPLPESPNPIKAPLSNDGNGKHKTPPTSGKGISDHSSDNDVYRTSPNPAVGGFLFGDSELKDDDIHLAVEDAIVRLNTLGIAMGSVQGLLNTLAPPSDTGVSCESVNNARNNDTTSGVIQSVSKRSVFGNVTNWF